MGKPMGMMCAGFKFNDVAEDEFHDWYDLEHIPERLRVKGFINAERWIGTEDPKIAFATYDVETIDVLQSAPYLAFTGVNQSPWTRRVESKLGKIGRFVGEQLVPGRLAGPTDAGGLLFVAMNVAAQAEAEFNQWYDAEHIPRLADVPGCLCARRFKAQSGSHKYFAVYHLASPDVCASKLWKEAAHTPWTAKIIAHTGGMVRVPMRRYVRAA
jgi:hypothetical protein